MRRYVDLDEALKLFDTDTNYYDGDGNAVGRLTYVEALQKTVKEKLLSLPLADVVEVVRCKDCLEAKEVRPGRYSCFSFAGTNDGNWYCPDGKRKEKNDVGSNM